MIILEISTCTPRARDDLLAHVQGEGLERSERMSETEIRELVERLLTRYPSFVTVRQFLVGMAEAMADHPITNLYAGDEMRRRYENAASALLLCASKVEV